ncbi:MAG: YlbF family regulator [Clostridiaceae bacterium]|nr:YlbF family regulator [Clostridiaceae bacterium]
MDVLIKAKELGESLAASPVVKRLRSAETALEADDRGMSLLEDQRLLQMELIKATREKNAEVDLKDIKDMLLGKQKEIDEYPLTHEYMEAKAEFDDLMKNINDIITFAVTGEACSPSKCSSCGGGCSHQ